MMTRRLACLLLLGLSLLPCQATAQETTNALTRTELREAELRRRKLEVERQEVEQEARRQDLASREADLAAARTQRSLSRLRELLSAIDQDDPRPMEEIARLRARTENIREERTRPEKRLELLTKRGDAVGREQVELAERLENLSEDIEGHRLQIARWVARSTVGMEADRIEKLIRDLPINPRPNVRLLAEKRNIRRIEQGKLTELLSSMSETEDIRNGIAPVIQLLENKNAQLDETISLLEEKFDLTRDREIREQLEVEKSRSPFYAARLEILKNQVASIDEALNEDARLRALYETELDVLREDFEHSNSGTFAASWCPSSSFSRSLPSIICSADSRCPACTSVTACSMRAASACIAASSLPSAS